MHERGRDRMDHATKVGNGVRQTNAVRNTIRASDRILRPRPS